MHIRGVPDDELVWKIRSDGPDDFEKRAWDSTRQKEKAASSAALVFSKWEFTWNRALRSAALPLPPHDERRASGDHAQREHDARLSRDSRSLGAWPLLCGGEPHVRDALPPWYDVRLVDSYGGN